MSACVEWNERLAASMSEALEVREAAELSAHLQTCAGCREERDALHSLVDVLKTESGGIGPTHSIAQERFAARLRSDFLGRQRRGLRWPQLALATVAASSIAFVSGNYVDRSVVPAPRLESSGLASVEELGVPGFDPLESWARTSDPLADELAIAQVDEGPFEGDFDPETSLEDDVSTLDPLLIEMDD